MTFNFNAPTGPADANAGDLAAEGATNAVTAPPAGIAARLSRLIAAGDQRPAPANWRGSAYRRPCRAPSGGRAA